MRSMQTLSSRAAPVDVKIMYFPTADINTKWYTHSASDPCWLVSYIDALAPSDPTLNKVQLDINGQFQQYTFSWVAGVSNITAVGTAPNTPLGKLSQGDTTLNCRVSILLCEGDGMYTDEVVNVACGRERCPASD